MSPGQHWGERPGEAGALGGTSGRYAVGYAAGVDVALPGIGLVGLVVVVVVVIGIALMARR
jgi:hypothetical protein